MEIVEVAIEQERRIDELEAEVERLERELGQYIGGEANEYGQSQMKIEKLMSEVERLEANEMTFGDIQESRDIEVERLKAELEITKEVTDKTIQRIVDKSMKAFWNTPVPTGE